MRGFASPTSQHGQRGNIEDALLGVVKRPHPRPESCESRFEMCAIRTTEKKVRGQLELNLRSRDGGIRFRDVALEFENLDE
ncbi:MAG: hypothetical protein ACRBN8_39895 [Nannocystales bacterium]